MLPKYNDDLKKDFNFVKSPDKTYFFDTEKNTIGGFTDGIDALSQTIRLMLLTNRFEHEIYSFNYGVELFELIGCPEAAIFPRIEKIFTDALMQDDRIISVSDFKFQKERDVLEVTFNVASQFGNISGRRVINV